MRIIENITETNLVDKLRNEGNSSVKRILSLLKIEEIDNIIDTYAEICGNWGDDSEEYIIDFNELHDFLWLEGDTYAQWIGVNDFDEIIERDEESE